MASSTVIELKELQNGVKENVSLPNGFFRTTLKNPITITEGTEISIKAGFCDTILSSQGKIHISGDETYAIGYTPFLQNIGIEGRIYNGNSPNTTASSFPIDNQAYFPCSGGHSTTGSYETIKSVTFFRNTNRVTPRSTWGDDSIYVPYINEAGVGTGVTLTLPPLGEGTSGEGIEYKIDLNKISKLGTFVLPGGKVMKKFKRKAQIENIVISRENYVPTGLHLEPLAFEFPFKLPKGDYLPNHLCEIITEILTDIQNTASSTIAGNDEPINNAFLKTNLQINAESGTYNLAGKTIFCSEDGNNLLQIPLTKHFPSSSSEANDIVPGFETGPFNCFIGSDQVVLEYDSEIQRCVWSQLHSNIYSSGSSGGSEADEAQDGAIVISSERSTYSGTQTGSFYASRSGCIAFNYFKSSNPDFWYGDLGLDPNMCIQFLPAKTDVSIGIYNNVSTYKIDNLLLPGINTTDSTVNSSASYNKNQYYNRVPDRVGLQSASNANKKVYGLLSLDTPNTEEGYFLISIDGFDENQKMITQTDEKNTIKGIVSRFYTSNSYTTFDGEGNISPYVHRGEPKILSGFNVKILNPEYTNCNIQDDNTIFLEILKPLEQIEQSK